MRRFLCCINVEHTFRVDSSSPKGLRRWARKDGEFSAVLGGSGDAKHRVV